MANLLISALLLAACVPEGLPVADTDGPWSGGTPSLTGIEWGCDVDAATWTFTADTEGWTGGGRVYMAVDLDRIESHRIYSVKADPDGAWDHLEMELAIQADWRDYSSGSATGWRCGDEEALSYQLLVYGAEGSAVGDCRTWGANPSLWLETEEVNDCEVPLEEGR